jgi:hypothetical protein
MFPMFALHNTINRAPRHFIAACEFDYPYSLIVLLAYITNVVIGKFCVAVLFATCQSFRVLCRKAIYAAQITLRVLKVAMTTLGNRIVHIFAVCAKPKMFRVPARRIVARVAHLHSAWYGAMIQFPFDLVNATQTTLVLNTTIALGVFCALPFPATTRRDKCTRQQSLFYRWVNALMRALFTAKELAIYAGAKYRATRFTGAIGYGTMGHVGTPFSVGHATAVSAARGFLLPLNYTRNGVIPQQKAI